MYNTLNSAIADAGKISLGNGKMPGSTFAMSATMCKTGGKLAQIKNSTCSRCYALKLEKLRPSVHMGWLANYTKATKLIATNPTQWAQACAFQINRAYQKSGEPYHRWFDSGDLQSVEMLRAIVLTCELTPDINHWLPTREATIVRDYLAEHGPFPSNLIVRVSATMIGDAPRNAAHTSTVHRKTDTHSGHACPASTQGNQCGTCRACWSHNVANVSYPLH
jgi:hypothetical protein